MKRRQSTQAQAASQIRKKLKKAYPNTKWSVTSDSFAGGTSVDVSWEDGPTRSEVEKITSPYQYGEFNGMIDMYENTNRRKDIPQVKYVMVQREPSGQTRQALIDEFEKEWGVEFNQADYDHYTRVHRKFRETAY